MLRTLSVNVASETWPRKTDVPPILVTAPSYQIDLAKAFLMLGTLTMPSLLSPASPARFWAWLRYFLAIADKDDLRITKDFAELDPHQKSILSDDFGVAISTQWLHDRFGGFVDVIDGRRFMMQFPHLLTRKKKVATAKVGPSKAPDFVFQDNSGKWHVLECKGTQSGRGWRNKFLKDALSQKQVIQINGRIRGERLAAGLSIANEDSASESELKIIDPEVDPILTLDDGQKAEVQSKVHRLAIARALGVVGLNDAAIELSLPPDVLSGADDFLRPLEALRARAPQADRSGRARRQMRDRNLVDLQFSHRKYEGRRADFELPEINSMASFNDISIRQGVSHELLQEISAADSLFDSHLSDRFDEYTAGAKLIFQSDGTRTTLTYGDVLFAELTLRKT